MTIACAIPKRASRAASTLELADPDRAAISVKMSQSKSETDIEYYRVPADESVCHPQAHFRKSPVGQGFVARIRGEGPGASSVRGFTKPVSASQALISRNE